jgi:hypothetical protein
VVPVGRSIAGPVGDVGRRRLSHHGDEKVIYFIYKCNIYLFLFLRFTQSFRSVEEEEMAAAVPEGYATTRDEATKDYIFQQTMLRVKDPKVSLDFYSRVLGMRCAFFFALPPIFPSSLHLCFLLLHLLFALSISLLPMLKQISIDRSIRDCAGC